MAEFEHHLFTKPRIKNQIVVRSGDYGGKDMDTPKLKHCWGDSLVVNDVTWLCLSGGMPLCSSTAHSPEELEG